MNPFFLRFLHLQYYVFGASALYVPLLCGCLVLGGLGRVYNYHYGSILCQCGDHLSPARLEQPPHGTPRYLHASACLFLVQSLSVH